MKKLLFAFTSLLPCFGQQLQPVPTAVNAAVTGTLTGDDGTQISGAYVSLGLLPPYPERGLRQTEWASLTDAGGSFHADQLTYGTYRIRVQASGSPWLNPCEWGLRPPTVSLTPDQPTADATVVLKKGAVVPVRLSDPGGLISQYQSTVPTAQVLIGVRNDAFFFRRATMVSSDATGRNHQILIPFGAAVDLIVCTNFFQLSNSAGVALPTSASIPILVQAGQQPPTISLVVTGGGLP